MTTILSIKQANKSISLISQAGRKLDERIHVVAVSGLAHFLQHGDTTLLTNLCHAMPKSGRGNALKFWITKHVRVKWSTKAHGGEGGFVKNGDLDLNSWAKIALVEKAALDPFYNKEDAEPKAWNPNASILNLVKKLNAYKEEHNLQLPEETKAALTRAIA